LSSFREKQLRRSALLLAWLIGRSRLQPLSHQASHRGILGQHPPRRWKQD
jgi:hypothetical protein